MLVSRSLLSDEVLYFKLGELQTKLLESLLDTHTSSTDFLIDNNQKAYDKADNDERKETLKKNVEQIEYNQENRITNVTYFENQINFIQSIISKKKTEFIEIDERLKKFVC